MPPPPGLTTRREFLERSAAAAALLALPWAAGCASGSDRRIVRAAIHPTIGVARVGNSPDSFFFGPEVPGALPRASEGFKDGTVRSPSRPPGSASTGSTRTAVPSVSSPPPRRISRGASRSRTRRPPGTTSPSPYDLPDAAPAALRNPHVAKRERLVVFPGERSVHGAGARPVPLHGSFLGVDVDLGELMTDGDGRLVLLPGPGRAYSKGNHPLTTFSGNDGWTDDVCDGPVHATVRIDGRTIEAEPAWALVTPPNYGPGMSTGLVTLYDAVRSMFVASGGLDAGEVSFADDILPIFARMTEMQWVNEGFFVSNGFDSKEDWLTDENVARLADPGARTFHRALFERFRNPAYLTDQPGALSGHVRRPRRHPAAERPPVAHGHATSVRPPRRVGGRPLHRRPRPRVHRVGRSREPAAGRAGARARPRLARVVPRRRVPSRNRGAVDAADRDDVGAPVQDARRARRSRRSTMARR